MANEFILAWEDLLSSGWDYDYNDFVAEIRWATPVPEPESYALLLAGLGLLGFAAKRRARGHASRECIRRRRPMRVLSHATGA